MTDPARPMAVEQVDRDALSRATAAYQLRFRDRQPDETFEDAHVAACEAGAAVIAAHRADEALPDGWVAVDPMRVGTLIEDAAIQSYELGHAPEWGYRCLAGGDFVEDKTPFEAATTLARIGSSLAAMLGWSATTPVAPLASDAETPAALAAHGGEAGAQAGEGVVSLAALVDAIRDRRDNGGGSASYKQACEHIIEAARILATPRANPTAADDGRVGEGFDIDIKELGLVGLDLAGLFNDLPRAEQEAFLAAATLPNQSTPAAWVNSLPGVKASDQFVAADRRPLEAMVGRALAAALATSPRAGELREADDLLVRLANRDNLILFNGVEPDGWWEVRRGSVKGEIRGRGATPLDALRAALRTDDAATAGGEVDRDLPNR